MILLFLLFLLLNSPINASENLVIINKFQYNPLDFKNEWVELYNTTDEEVDLNDWYLADENNTKKLLTNKKIGAKSFLTFEDGRSWLNNTASNNDGDSVFLKIGDSVVDSVDYKRVDGKIKVLGQIVSESDLILKGKWIGRSDVGSTSWQVFADTEGPIGGAISYFDGYKTTLQNIEIGVTEATDSSGIGATAIKMYEGVLENNICLNFGIGSSLSDGHCYKYEYVATDGVGNSRAFTSNSIVKFDTTKPIFSIKNAFRNILKIKSEFMGTDPESGIMNYKYGLGETRDWYMGNRILYIGYTGDPKTICGMGVNNAGLQSEVSCMDFVIDIVAPKIILQNNPALGLYKIGDTLNFDFEFDEEIETTGNNFEIKLNSGEAKFIGKTNNLLNFEYVVMSADETNNLSLGQTKIELNSGSINDLAGNEANLLISNMDDGVKIDGVIPQISIVGETYVEIPQFGAYFDLGATASDSPDGDLTSKILIDNQVEEKVGGIYDVIYSIADRAGNENSVVRKVKVVDTSAPIINQLLITNYELRINSSEDGYVEWSGKCSGENNNIVMGDNVIKLKNNGDGVYDDCEIRAWDKWGNVGQWQTIDSFVVDTTAPVISFINSSQGEIDMVGNENLKECNVEKENIISGDFETGSIDGWQGDWVTDNLHFASGAWSAKSPILTNEDLVEKSIWQTVNLENGGELSFWWRVSSEKDWDYLKLYIDNVLIDKISGEVGWREVKHNLVSGTHTIKFTYSKDYSGETGEDTGWIDDIKIGGGNIAPMTVSTVTANKKINNLVSGSNKYRVICTDMYDNKSNIIVRNIIKEVEKVIITETPIPAPHRLNKLTTIVPTVKPVKTTVVKKSGTVLGIKAVPSVPITITTTPPATIKLKANIPWSEIKFWMMGLLTLGTSSGVILLDKKVI